MNDKNKTTPAATEVEIDEKCILCSLKATIEIKKGIYLCDDCVLIAGDLAD
ncbi:hypothetical protein [Bacillus pumilus]|uniref:hypothetical protein n=1 Tax=Bacillus pumilus TaxID=1408 RepID=UPI00164363D4|nr:hypothetical protein [Bacillus pumilus]